MRRELWYFNKQADFQAYNRFPPPNEVEEGREGDA